MTLWLLIPLILCLQYIYWYIGKKAAQKVHGQKDYFLAGKGVRFFPLMMTFIGAQVGGGLVLGAADTAFEYGWWVLLYPLGTCLGLLLLGIGIGKRLTSFKTSTIAQILEIVYKSRMLKKIASTLSIISLFMILAAQFTASHTFLLALGLINPLFFIAFWGVIIFYTVRGGLRAVIATDVVQATVFSLVLCGCFALLFFGGMLPSFSLKMSSFTLSSTKLVGWLLMPLLYMMIEQDMGQRCFAGDSPQTVSKAALGAGICTMLICVVPITLGVFAKTMGLTIPVGASTLMTAISFAGGPWITALVGCAVLAAIISTATSLINAISSNLSQDFDIFRNQENLKAAKWITLGISVGAMVFAFYFNDIVGILIQSYELFVSALFVPIFIALFKKHGNFLSALLAISFGMGSFILFKIVPLPFPAEIMNILLSFVGYGCGEVISHFRKEEVEFTIY
ncbi:MAG: sodium:solute symporter family protein [Chlamydiia bacterium]|nr:sodium:solute symporter family protein [Chlamydiia bacterium]